MQVVRPKAIQVSVGDSVHGEIALNETQIRTWYGATGRVELHGPFWHLAGLWGLEVPEPISESETEKRKLRARLLERGFQWVRTPRLTQMPHEIAVVDIRLATRPAGFHRV